MQNYFQIQAIGANKRQRTRGTLIDSAIDVFSGKGIEEASIQEITAIAGLANGTFYNHFKDKDELALASAEAITWEIAKRLDSRMSEVQRGASRVVIASWSFLLIALANRAWAQVLVGQHQRHPSADSPAFDYIRADIELAMSQLGLDEQLDDFLIEQIAALMMSALHALLRDGRQTHYIVRTCEHVLRLIGMTPAQAKREVSRVEDHALLNNAALLDDPLTG